MKNRAETDLDRLTDREIRERFIARGAEALSDGELLCLLLQEGSGDRSTIALAERVLSHSGGSLNRVARDGLKRLRMVEGLGIKRGSVVLAALELGRRAALEEGGWTQKITNDGDIIEIFRPMLAHLDYEEFWVVYMSSANTVLDKIRIGQGGVDGVLVDHKLIVKRALELLSTNIILVHNHPSGVCDPSDDDFSLTEKISKAASLFDIEVVDHLIITNGESYSFKKNGHI